MRRHDYNLKKDIKDSRDFLFKAPAGAPTPDVVDWRRRDVPIFYQGKTGCCCSVAVGMSWHFQMHQQSLGGFSPSVLFLYYNSRKRMSDEAVKFDCGGTIRDSMKTLAAVGVCRDRVWPFTVENLFLEPPPGSYTEADKHKAIAYESIEPDMTLIETALASGSTVCFGLQIFESMESRELANTGIMKMPDESKERHLGGHALRIVGYNRPERNFIVANSWGPRWGLQGYFMMPYDAAIKYGSDYWALKLVA